MTTTGPPSSTKEGGLRRVMVAVGLVVGAAAALAIPAQAGHGAQTLADEPQYLMSAGSLYHQRSLDIADDLEAERWRAYHGADLPEQTAARPDGRRLSPHDPLLPLVLAVPVALGGWVAAKATLALLAGVLAAVLVWTAVVRFAVPLGVAAAVVIAFGVVPPLVAYGSQVYPELPAALLVTIAVAAMTGPLGRGGRWSAAAAITALPWLAVKYTPVAAALAVVLLAALWRGGQRRAVPRTGAALAAAGVGFLAFHQAVYGGWTVYAAGDHFSGGELTVMGADPDYAARAIRLVGLLLDRDFGLVAWAPAYLLAVPAVAALIRRRPSGTAAILLPLAAGWLNATFLALTMHGWWWPGRQVVVVVPLAVLAVAWWMSTVAGWAHSRGWLVAATALGVLTWAWLLVKVIAGGRALIIDFAQAGGPLSMTWRLLLPDDRVLAPVDVVRLVGWIAVLAALAICGWRQASASLSSGGQGEPGARHRARWLALERPPGSHDPQAGSPAAVPPARTHRPHVPTKPTGSTTDVVVTERTF